MRRISERNSLMDDNTPYWLALTQVDGLGARSAHKLTDRFGSARDVYRAPLTRLEGCGLPAQVARAIGAQTGIPEAEARSRLRRRPGPRF